MMYNYRGKNIAEINKLLMQSGFKKCAYCGGLIKHGWKVNTTVRSKNVIVYVDKDCLEMYRESAEVKEVSEF